MVKLITWNMQGAAGGGDFKWAEAKKAMDEEKAELVCLQECGARPASAEEIETHDFPGGQLNLYKWNKRYITFCNWDLNGNRCNLAILSREQPAGLEVAYHPSEPYRPAIGVKLADGRYYYSIHAMSGGGPDAGGILEEVRKKHNAATWVVAGDYNRSPQDLRTSPYAGNWHIHDTDRHTYNAKHETQTKTLDYMVTSMNIAIQTGDTLSGYIFISDHMPVAYTV